MSLFAFTLQVLLPISMLVWLALFPANGILTFFLQTVSIACVLLGLGLVSLWTMPPFWVPWVYGATFTLIVSAQLIKGNLAGSFWNTGACQSLLIMVACCLAIVAGYMTYKAFQGRTLPDVKVVNIAPPFGSGHYLVAHGGSTEMVNVHLHTLDASIERFGAWRGQSRGLDIFRTTAWGLHKKGWLPTDPSRYLTYGTPVLAPCDGTVAMAVEGIADMPVPVMDREHMAGNHLAIDCGEFFVVLAHLRRESVTVAINETVTTGQNLAQMGNSGNSSEPHLHVQAQRRLPEDAPLSGRPLCLTIDGRFLARNDRIHIGD